MAGKGYHGETTAQAAENAIKQFGNKATAAELFNEIKNRGSWTDDNIWQTLLAATINLPASYGHWPESKPEKRFLFLLESGDYELYQPKWHGEFESGRRI